MVELDRRKKRRFGMSLKVSVCRLRSQNRELRLEDMKPAASEVAFGMRAHTGWAMLVAVAGPLRTPRILYRSRLELCDGAFPRFVYHQAQAAPIGEARKLAQVAEKLSRKAAENGIRDALTNLATEGSRVTAAIVLVSPR
jgi:hypothetical protein